MGASAGRYADDAGGPRNRSAAIDATTGSICRSRGDLSAAVASVVDRYVEPCSGLYFAQRRFLGIEIERCPTLSALPLGAVGKSTTARVLQALAGAMVAAPKVDLVTTTAFCFPTPCLSGKPDAEKKGFPRATICRRCCRF